MAKSKGGSSTFSIVVILLLSVAVFVLASLYLETRHKNKLLVLEVERLEGTQVLLMVPDEQAEVVAKWMSENPEATKAILTQAKPQQKVNVSVGPGNEAQADKASLIDNTEQINKRIDNVEMLDQASANLIETELIEKGKEENTQNNLGITSSEATEVNVSPNAKNIANARTVSENDEGVKVIVLPHGGIRVTTRELD